MAGKRRKGKFVMKWVTYRSQGEEDLAADETDRVGLLVDGEVRSLEAGTRLIDLLGDDGTRLRAAADRARNSPMSVEPVEGIRLRPPIPSPPSIRDFFAFEQHAKSGIKALGMELDPGWYEIPIFYFTNSNAVVGDGDVVTFAGNTQEMDFELELGVVVGKAGKNLDPIQAESHIAGFCIFNDWSARDLQHWEQHITPIGPSKGKDFANGLGPCLVTADEFEDRRKGKSYDLTMTASVNGREYGRASLADIFWGFGEMISYASREAYVLPGDIIGSGTCPQGCIMELSTTHGLESFPWLVPGDEVVLEVEGIGAMRNVVAQGPAPKPLR
jgi:2-keto-4-pentenoate hydratase/2-oxohepta-3-ene-1,7-dioic acid hydratase in catechol pathway